MQYLIGGGGLQVCDGTSVGSNLGSLMAEDRELTIREEMRGVWRTNLLGHGHLSGVIRPVNFRDNR